MEGWYRFATPSIDGKSEHDEYRLFRNSKHYATVHQPHSVSGVVGSSIKTVLCYNLWRAGVKGADYDSLHAGPEQAMSWAEKMVERKLSGEAVY